MSLAARLEVDLEGSVTRQCQWFFQISDALSPVRFERMAYGDPLVPPTNVAAIGSMFSNLSRCWSGRTAHHSLTIADITKCRRTLSALFFARDTGGHGSLALAQPTE